VPYKLIIEGIQDTADFTVSVKTEPSSENPRQDFEFFDLSQSEQTEKYCVTGRLRNLGGELEEYLVLVAVLFDGQDKVVSYGDYHEFDLAYVIGGETAEFEVCADNFNQDIARYELRAWGL
jgi:hypothetical protein